MSLLRSRVETVRLRLSSLATWTSGCSFLSSMPMWHYRCPKTKNESSSSPTWYELVLSLFWCERWQSGGINTSLLHSLHCCEPPPAAVVAQLRIVAHIQNVEFRQGHFVTQPKVNINKWKWIWAFLFIPCPYQIEFILHEFILHEDTAILSCFILCSRHSYTPSCWVDVNYVSPHPWIFIVDCCHPPLHLSGAAEEKLMGTLAEVPSSPHPNLDKHQSPETLSSHTASATDKSSAVYWHRK